MKTKLNLHSENVSIVGCGIIGSAIAKRLLKNDVPLIAYNRTKKKADDLKNYGNVKVVQSLEDVFVANIIIITLSSIESILSFIENSTLQLGLKQIVLTSNVSLKLASKLLQAIKKRDGKLVQVAFLSGREQIESGYATAVVYSEYTINLILSHFIKNIIEADSFNQVHAFSFSYIAYIHISTPFMAYFITLIDNMGMDVDTILDRIDSLFPSIESVLNTLRDKKAEDNKNKKYISSFLNQISHIGQTLYGLDSSIIGDIKNYLDSINCPEISNFKQDNNMGTGEFDYLKLIQFFLIFFFISYKISEKIASSSGITGEKYLKVLKVSSYGNLISASRVMYHMRWKTRCFVGNIEITDQTVFDEFQIVQEYVKSIYQKNIISNLGLMYEQSLAKNTTGKPCSFASYYQIIYPKVLGSDNQKIIEDNRSFLNSHKINFLIESGIDFVIGKRNHLYLYDNDDPQKILCNLHCNGGVFNFGHRNQSLWQKFVSSQLDIGNHHLISKTRGEAAKKFVKILPHNLSKITFVSSGSEGIDLSIKIARSYTRRKKIISCNRVWHGVTGNSVYTTDHSFRSYYGETPKEYVHVNLWDLGQIKNEIHDAAAVIYEASPSSYDCSSPPKDFFEELSKICKQNGVLLIIDEVQTGMGRTGKFWYTDDLEIDIDFLVASKGLTGGIYPLAIIAYKKCYEDFFKESPFMYQSTCAGSEIGCELLVHQLDLIDHQFLTHVNNIADYFSKKLRELQVEFPGILKKINQKGLFISIGFEHESYAAIYFINSFNNGMFIFQCGFNQNFIQFLPPLTITIEEAELIVTKFRFLLKKLYPLYQLINNRGIPLKSVLSNDERENTLRIEKNTWKKIGKGMMFNIFKSSSGQLFGKFCKKKMQNTNFKTNKEFEEYIKLIEQYTLTLSRLNIPVLFTWFDTNSKELFQPLVDQSSMLITQLKEKKEQEIRYYFKCLIRIVMKCINNNVGLDATLENWFIRGDNKLCLLDTGQPLMKDKDNNFIPFGSGVFKKIIKIVLKDYFDLSFVLKNIAVNMYYSSSQIPFIPILLEEIQEEAGIFLTTKEIKKELFIDKTMRLSIKIISSGFLMFFPNKQKSTDKSNK